MFAARLPTSSFEFWSSEIENDGREEVQAAVQELFKKSQGTHPAISEWHEPRAHIWMPLWDGMFESDTLKSWQQDSSKHVLRCVGAPGSGKVKLFQGLLSPVLYVMLGVVIAADEAVTYVAKYRQYFATGERGHSDDIRIQLLRDALHSCLGLLDHAFLVVDGVDRCSPAVELLLENELLFLASKGLKVFLTSRIYCSRTSPVVFCDSCPQESRKHLDIYWVCETCNDTGFGSKDGHVLCQSCRDEGRTCNNCGNMRDFIQPYDYVELNLNVDQQSFERFIDWNLEMEHGDLGLCSTNEIKPPNSGLGRELIKARNHDALFILRKKIAHKSGANVSLVLLRLSNVHQLQSVDSILSPMPDTLPTNTVAFFHAGMQRIEEQSLSERDLGFKAIAAVAHYGYRGGVTYEALHRLLQTPTKTLARHQPISAQYESVSSTAAGAETRRSPLAIPVSHRCLDEMLHAACGFLVTDTSVDNLHLATIRTYCKEFHVYARENYNESLFWAHTQLRFDSVVLCTDGGLAKPSSRSVKRSQTAKMEAIWQASLETHPTSENQVGK
ncbi:hypothetical protein CSUB01_11924 [Colletotrichum sublineola]|uniref:Uncharacterized protein n=1 Tax=Colletotrichum sublineola TaxID=1173701 RepID=A0A066XQY4_COLSU|nr:hypothetical protein CSUB01_11924 [Colletotrichum sublineola]